MFTLIKDATARVHLLVTQWSRSRAPYHLDALRHRGGVESVVRVLEESDGAFAVQTLRAMGATVGAKVRIGRGLTLHNAELPLTNLVIGDDCHIGRQVFLDVTAPIWIGNHVTITMRTTMLTHVDTGGAVPQHADRLRTRAGIRIEDEVYVGAGSTIMPGVTVGSGSLVAASSLVNKDVPLKIMVAGVPARALGK